MPPWASGAQWSPTQLLLQYGQGSSGELNSELVWHWEHKLLPAYWSCLSIKPFYEETQERLDRSSQESLKAKTFSASVFWRKPLIFSLFLFFFLHCFSPFFPSPLPSFHTLSCSALLHTDLLTLSLGDSEGQMTAASPEFQGKPQIQTYLLLSSKFHSFKSCLSL